MKGHLVSLLLCRECTSSIDISESDEEVKKLIEAYRFMNDIFSPSHPEAMSPCEWEAHVTGAIPIIQRSLLA
jgi:hypothetical protein